jgi:valyl-tRNA synthetase
MEDVQHFHEEVSEARKAVLHKIESQGLVVKEEDWPTELGEMEKPGGGVDPKVLAERELERTRKSLDPGLR